MVSNTVGSRIYVKTDMFEGWATVTHVIPSELFPIQVELEQPDSDGHSVKRVSKSEITEERSDNMDVNIKRLDDNAVIPKYAKDGDAGFDLVAIEDVIIEPGDTALVKTGLAFELPQGYEMQIRPRSGVTLKTKLRVQLGTIDSGFRGDVGVIVDNISEDACGNVMQYLTQIDGLDYRTDKEVYPNDTYIIRKGDRIAQAVIAPITQATFNEVDELSETERSIGGFGSSGIREGE